MCTAIPVLQKWTVTLWWTHHLKSKWTSDSHLISHNETGQENFGKLKKIVLDLTILTYHSRPDSNPSSCWCHLCEHSWLSLLHHWLGRGHGWWVGRHRGWPTNRKYSTHWHLGDLDVIFKFPSCFTDWYLALSAYLMIMDMIIPWDECQETLL